MNREIKFRVWTGTHWLKPMEMAKQLLVGSSTENYGQFSYGDYEMSEYTGLKDKNGTEIYEGDIVAIDMWQGSEHGYIPEDGIIKWHDESSAFKWFSGEPSDGNNYWLSQADTKQREVIGNIYENKDLLK